MTGRWIDELREQADKGDAKMQEFLSGTGLWQSEEAAAEEEAAYAAVEEGIDQPEEEN